MDNKPKAYDQLKLENQLCFPVYAASRLIIREYQPYLDKIGITYPQYLALMVLWENDGQAINNIASKLILNTNTVTPLLKRMENQGLISRQRSASDERKVMVFLTEQGKALKEKAQKIPHELSKQLINGPLNLDEIIRLKTDLNAIITLLSKADSK